jgi:hypothetical protein
MNNRRFTSCSLRFKLGAGDGGAGDGNRTRVLSLEADGCLGTAMIEALASECFFI